MNPVYNIRIQMTANTRDAGIASPNLYRRSVFLGYPSSLCVTFPQVHAQSPGLSNWS